MSLSNNFSYSDSKSGVNKTKMNCKYLPLSQKKWIEKIKEKCQGFLGKMKTDAKTEPILAKPMVEIYNEAFEIYSKDGKSLEKWLNESTASSIQNGSNAAKDEGTISTYKEQFKNMLALDIWIDKLLLWQESGYKLEIPQKQKVDPLQWNITLRQKLSKFIKDDK